MEDLDFDPQFRKIFFNLKGMKPIQDIHTRKSRARSREGYSECEVANSQTLTE